MSSPISPHSLPRHLAGEEQTNTTNRPYGFPSGHFHENETYEVVRPRGTESWLLLYTVSGCGLLQPASGEPGYRLKPGEACLYHPGMHQDYSTDPATGCWELLWAHYVAGPMMTRWMSWRPVWPGLSLARSREGPEREDIEEALQAMVQTWKSLRPRRVPLCENHLTRALILLSPPQAHEESARPVDPRIESATRYLTENLARPYNPETLARTAGLSPSHLIARFREVTGQPPTSYLEQLRLERAADLLRGTSHSVQTVADQVGFADPFYFSRRFRRRYGQSPRQFRQKG